MIYCVVGGCFSGKTSLVEKIHARAGFPKLIPVTTDNPLGCTNGVDYVYADMDSWHNLLMHGAIVAPMAKGTCYYAWPHQEVMDKDVVLEADYKAAEDFRTIYGTQNVSVIFLDISKEARLRALDEDERGDIRLENRIRREKRPEREFITAPNTYVLTAYNDFDGFVEKLAHKNEVMATARERFLNKRRGERRE